MTERSQREVKKYRESMARDDELTTLQVFACNMIPREEMEAKLAAIKGEPHSYRYETDYDIKLSIKCSLLSRNFYMDRQ